MITPPTPMRAAGRRAVIAAAALGLVVAVLGMWLSTLVHRLGDEVHGPAPTEPAQVLTLGAAVAALAILLWLTARVLVEVLAFAPGAAGRLADRLVGRPAAQPRAGVAPPFPRRVAAVLVGVGLGGALASGTALAASEDGRLPPPGFVATAPSRPGASPAPMAAPDAAGRARPVDNCDASGEHSHTAEAPGWTPGPPRVRPQPSPGLLSPAPRERDEGVVVVRRGDTLWDIAERHLGAGASEAEIAAEWPRWYAANQAVIGEDPHHILPGQRLHSPAPAAHR